MDDMMSPKEIQEILDKYTYCIDNGIPITEDLANAMKDASVGVKNYTRTLKASKDALWDSTKQLGMAMVDGKSGAQVYNDVIDKGTKTFSAWNKGAKDGSNKLGKLAEGAAALEAMMAKQADALFESYQSISRSGVATSMDDTFKNLQNMGYTMKEIGQYGDLMKQNSTVLANLGGTSADGAEKFAKSAKLIHSSGLDTEFRRMGMTTQDINSGMVNYVKFQQLSGSTLQQDDKHISQSAAEFITQQDILTKITGHNADQQNAIYEKALAQEQFAAKTFQLQQQIAKYGADSEQGKAAQAELAFNNAMIQQAARIGPEETKNTQLFLAGAIGSKGYQQYQRSHQEMTGYLQSGGRDLRTASQLWVKDTRQIANDQADLYRLNGAEAAEAFGSFPEKNKLLGMKDFADGIGKAAQDQKEQRKGKDEATDNMVQTTQDQIDASQAMNQALNKGLPLVTKGLSEVAAGGEQLAGVFGELAGKKGRMGGGTTLWDKTKNFLGVSGGAAAGAAGGVVAPTPSKPQPSPSGADLDSFINFGGNTGDKNHFQQLNPTVMNSFIQMAKAYFDSTGKKLQINSAFRTPEEQASISSGNNPKAAPGKSLHNVGKAIDINSSQRSELASNGMLGQYGFSLPPFEDAPHIQMPQAATGGILSGPRSGYQAMLHGNEAVVPLPDGKTIPVQTKGNSSSAEQVNLLMSEIDKLDAMLRVMSKQNDITTKILQRQS